MLPIKKLEIIKISYSRLLKLEVPQFVNEVLDIVEKHDPELLKVDATYNLLIAKKPEIAKLVVWHRAHPLTKELKELREMRRLYVRFISQRLEVVIKEDVSGVNKSVQKIVSEVTRFLENFGSSRNEAVKCQKVTQFYTIIDENEELEEAFSTFKFTEQLNNLRNVHATILELRAKRMSDISLRSKDKTSDLVNSVLSSTIVLFNDLERAALVYPDIVYDLVFNELNDLLIYYRDLINRRMMQNKKKAELANAAKGPNTGIITEETTTTEQAEPTSRMMNVEDGNGFEVMKPIENKKAAAPSSKPLQLPPLNNEG